MDELIDLAQWIEDKLDKCRDKMAADITIGGHHHNERAYWNANGEAIGYLEVLVHLQQFGVGIVNGRAESIR